MTLRLVVLALCALSACATPSSSASSPASPAPTSERQKDVERAIERNDWPAALSGAQALTREEPENPKAWRYLGLAHVNQGDPAGAIPAFQRSVELQDTAKTRGNLGFAYAMQGRVEQALPEFQRAVELDPKYGPGWLYVGKAQLQLGERQKAREALERAHALMPDNAEANDLLSSMASGGAEPPKEALQHHARGAVLFEQGKLDDAERAFRDALAVAPGFADCHYNLGKIARAKGDLDAAEREYRAAIAGYSPQEAMLRADAENNLADLLTSRGKHVDEAVQLVRDAISLRGERPSFIDTLARACDAQGDTRCAVEAFRKLLAQGAPLPPEVRAHAEERLRALDQG